MIGKNLQKLRRQKKLTQEALAEKIGVDPAVMANPLISTLTDAVSLLIYIYIAKLILHI